MKDLLFIYWPHPEREGRAMVLGNFKCRDGLLIWIMIGQGPTLLAVRATEVVGIFIFSRLLFLSLSLYLRHGSIWTEILSERAVKPKARNH